jgi:hypothetical protein
MFSPRRKYSTVSRRSWILPEGDMKSAAFQFFSVQSLIPANQREKKKIHGPISCKGRRNHCLSSR